LLDQTLMDHRGLQPPRASRCWPSTPAPVSDAADGIAGPVVVARLLAWLASEENTHLCGQVVFVDCGAEALLRGDSTW
jgi:hypothetical protein